MPPRRSFFNPFRFVPSLLAVLAGLLPFSSFAGPFDPALRWKTTDTEHFSIHFYEGEEGLAKRLGSITEEVYATLSKKFDAHPAGRTEVVLIDNFDTANGSATVIPYNIVVLRAVPPLADSFLSDYDDWLRQLFAHEYTHIIHISDTRPPAKLLKLFLGKLVAPNASTPGWVTEGLATYFETALSGRGRGVSSLTEMLLRTDILQGRFLHLDQMAGTRYEWPGWLAQYLYGVAFWDYLAKTYGEETLIEFSHKYGASLRLFMINSQARRVWKLPRTPEEEGLCSEVHWSVHKTWKSRRTYPQTCGNRGLSFYKLWHEWNEDLTRRYAAEKVKVTAAGLKEGETLLVPREGESFSLPTFSPDGGQLAYLATSVNHPQELRLRDLAGGKERVLLKKREVQQIGFSPDQKKIVVSHVGSHKKYYQYSDLHEIDLGTGHVKQLTKGKRARDPDYSPDGKIVAVLQGTGSSKLAVFDPEKEEWKVLLEGGQFDHPRWLPDGKLVVVSRHLKGQRDLWVIGTDGARRITTNLAVEDRPTISAVEQAIYFSSDRSGIPNIYRYDLNTGRTSQITNVLTGAFAPSISPDGKRLVFQYYNGRGFEVREISRNKSGPLLVGRDLSESRPTKAYNPGRDESERASPAQEGERRVSRRTAGDPTDYRPFRRLFIPRYVLPNAALIDNAVFLSAQIGNSDPISRHIWYGGGTYRSDNNFFGLNGGYTYNRYLTPFFIGYGDFSVNYGNLFGTGANFFEGRRRGFIGMAIPIPKQRVTFLYFFEDRRAQSVLPVGATLSTLGHTAGLFAQYSFRTIDKTAAGISPEEGQMATANFEVSDSRFGSATQLQQRLVWGDLRSFVEIPFAPHHVFALRAVGGAAFGEPFLQGNFSLGGSLGESPFVGASTRLFTLRGLPLATFSRDRAWVASAEYRLPLFRLQRGAGTLPFALNTGHFALFADIGDAFNRGGLSFRPLLGVGGELRGDFIVAYHIPVTGRLGYGLIVTNRPRIAGVSDALTGNDARNGVLILEVGTSF